MNRSYSFLLIAVIFLLIALGACKKYPDGPYLSFRSKTERVAGMWHIVSVKVNGAEQNLTQPFSVDGIITGPPYNIQTIEFTKDGKVNLSWTDYSFFPAGNSTGEWKFNDDKSMIMIKMEGEVNWKEQTILKLKNNEIWVKETINGNEKETHLESS